MLFPEINLLFSFVGLSLLSIPLWKTLHKLSLISLILREDNPESFSILSSGNFSIKIANKS
jgi:hypothetical protein